ncbi:MAG: NAD(P)/FAD-dependent oxidoreductase [Acuticoccus sp.]
MAPGGQIWRAAEAVAGDTARGPALSASYEGAAAAIAAARAHATLRAGAEVVDISAERDILWFDRAERRLRQTRARAILVATGAMERPVAFPGWTLPGVSGAGALQIALKQGGLVPEGPVVLAGQGPLLLLLAAQLDALGAEIGAMLHFGPPLPPRAALARLPAALRADAALLGKGVALSLRRQTLAPLYRRVQNLRATGTDAVEAVHFEADGMAESVPVARLAVHDGVVPNTQLTRLLGLDHRWIAAQAAFAPIVDDDGATSREGIFVAGDGAGIGGAVLAARSGRRVAAAICRALGASAGAAVPPPPARRAARDFVDVLYAPRPVSAFARDDTLLCRCESVTFGDVRRVVRLGATGPNRVKTATRCGMGPCQGRMCGGNLNRLIGEETGSPPEAVGALRIRPPLKPILLGDYAALAADDAA